MADTVYTMFDEFGRYRPAMSDVTATGAMRGIPSTRGAYRSVGFMSPDLQATAPTTGGAQVQGGDGTPAALRSIDAIRAGGGVGEGMGAIGSGQQPTREAQDFGDFANSAARGLGAVMGPFGLASYMADQAMLPDQTGRVSGAGLNPFNGGLAALARSAFGGAAPTGGEIAAKPGEFDMTGEAAARERGFGADYRPGAVTSDPIAPPTDTGQIGGFDPTTGMAPGERDMGIDRSVTSEALGPVGTEGGAGAGGPSGASGSGAASPDANGDHAWRMGGPVGRPGSAPMPVQGTVHTGEFVQRPEAVNKYGPGVMAALNSLKANPAAVKKAAKAPPKSAPKPGQKAATKKPGGSISAITASC